MNPVHLAAAVLRRPGLLFALAGLAAALVPPAVQAGVFSVVPVRIYMTPRDRAVAITVSNEGDSPMVLQAEINTWRQKPDGSDEQVATEDLILSPPILKLPPKGRQVVRLARVNPADLSNQLSYRLILREVPEVTAPREPAVQIPISLALSMPVFITPPAAKRQVACDAARGADKALQVSCANQGNAYAQVREVQVRRANQVLGQIEGGFYILPGARKALTLQPTAVVAPGPAQLQVGFDDGLSQTFDIIIP